jgi:cephalosporin-C deacetylase-like acetyl esterase
MNPYYYKKSTQEPELQIKRYTSKSLHYSVKFRNAINTGHPENGMIKGEFYLPKIERKIPLAILVHGMGDYSVIPCKLIARSLLRQGIACFIPYLTTHSKRIPADMRVNLPYLTPDQWFQSYRISVVDIRQVLDWAYSRTELDIDQVVIVGISFGGFVSAIAMGIDKRIKAGIFITTGGNSNKISWLSKDNQYRKRYKRTEDEHLKIQRSYAKYLNEISEKGFESITADDQSFLTDPLTFANDLKGRPILMINALYDKYIPKEAVTELWQACGQPSIKWIPSGHASIWLWYPTIRRRIMTFLESYGFI